MAEGVEDLLLQMSLDIPDNDKKIVHHSCRYCECSSPASVVRCSCGLWFCNGQSGGASHIVSHLVKSRHKEVSLHSDSPLGDATLECYLCGGKNVFLLGFVPSKQDAVVVLLCREPCLHNPTSLQDSTGKWDLSAWQSLIEERSFLPWLVRPSEEDEGKAVTLEQICLLEEAWKGGNKTATIQSLSKSIEPETVHEVRLMFDSAEEYLSIFSPLLAMEGESDRELKESHIQGELSVRWGVNINKQRCAYFFFTREEHEARLMPGDELRLTLSDYPTKGDTWEGLGNVVNVRASSEEVCLEMRSNKSGGPWESDRPVEKGYRVSYVWKSVTFDRMQSALRAFANDSSSMSTAVYNQILTGGLGGGGLGVVGSLSPLIPLPNEYSAPNLPRLNHSQIYAVRKALSTPLCLIQGPPGTGKTLTSATLVYHLAKAGGQVLVCAPSNVAVDQLALKIHSTGLKVVRITAKSREDIESSCDFLTLHEQMKKLKSRDQSEWVRLSALRSEVGELASADERRFRNLRSRLEGDLLGNADVVCVTCVGGGDPRLSRMRFKHVLVDETTQATEPEALIPLVHGSKHVILVGDHCQLGPVVVNKVAAKAGLKQSMFERLIALGVRPVRLEVQYRMHPALSEFPSAAFYEGSLQNGVTASDRKVGGLDFPWPDPENPIFFYNSVGVEEISASGVSYLNRAEAANIEKIVSALMRGGLQANQIGIITPYEGQRAHIQATLQRSNNREDIEIASVDSFQGREKDFILLSCVRSNKQGGLGFLNDPRRLNVALTRARYGLVICGNANTLLGETGRKKPSVWALLLASLKKKNLIVEGPLGALRVSPIAIGGGRDGPVKAPGSYFGDKRRNRSDSASGVSVAWSEFEIDSQRG